MNANELTDGISRLARVEDAIHDLQVRIQYDAAAPNLVRIEKLRDLLAERDRLVGATR